MADAGNRQFSSTAAIPSGITNSFSNVKANVATANFDIQASEGGHRHIITFQPTDLENPGTLTLYDNAGNAQITMGFGGHAPFIPPATGGTFYFKSTQAIQLVALTRPTNHRGQ